MAKKKKVSYKTREPSPKSLILPSAIYGGTRQFISNSLSRWTAKIPLGRFADELVLGSLAYYGSKKLKSKFWKNYARSALVVESARVGQGVIGNLGALARGSTSTSGTLF